MVNDSNDDDDLKLLHSQFHFFHGAILLMIAVTECFPTESNFKLILHHF